MSMSMSRTYINVPVKVKMMMMSEDNEQSIKLTSINNIVVDDTICRDIVYVFVLFSTFICYCFDAFHHTAQPITVYFKE